MLRIAVIYGVIFESYFIVSSGEKDRFKIVAKCAGSAIFNSKSKYNARDVTGHIFIIQTLC
jgi:hypothetical protein